MSKEAEEYFKEEWGTGFIRATLHGKDELLQLSMNDIYETMDKFAKHKLEKFSKKSYEAGQSKQLRCVVPDCNNEPIEGSFHGLCSKHIWPNAD